MSNIFKRVWLPILSCLMLIGTGCNSPAQKTKPLFDSEWQSLTIVSENSTVIKIDHDNPSIVEVYSSSSHFSRDTGKVKTDTITANFTMAEKDSLVSLAKDIIANPIKVKEPCTEYLGRLSLTIDYGEVKQQIAYQSICNWNTLSDKTAQLHSLLRKKIKGVYLGERKVK